MAGVLIFLLLIFLIFYILTRIAWVRIIKEENLKIEIHLPIFALHILIKKKNNKAKRRDKEGEISYLGYFRLIGGVVARLKNASIDVKKICLPIKTDSFSSSTLIKPLGQQAIICAFIAYLRTKTEKLIVNDNAISLSPDINEIQCHVTVKLMLFQLIYGLLSIRHSVYEEKKR